MIKTLRLGGENITAQGLAALVKAWRFSLVNDMILSFPNRLNDKCKQMFDRNKNSFRKFVSVLVCLASVRTIPRVGVQSPHFRELSSDLLIRVVQTLGWFTEYKGLIDALERYDGDEDEDEDEIEDEEE